MITWYIVGVIVCIALSGFFSASEMSFSSANRMRLENLAEDGSKSAQIAVRVLSRFDDALSAVLICNNLVNTACSSIASVLAILLVGEQYTPIATAVVTVLVIVFGETLPKILAKKNANRMSLAVARPVRFLMLLLKPLIFVVVGLVGLLIRPLKGSGDEQEIAVEELQSLIEIVEDEGVIDEERSELLQAALGFSDISASEVMTPG